MKRSLKRPFGPILWFGQGTDALPVTCHRRRVYILPTGYGFLFLGILLAMLLGSINYNNNLGFLLVFLLGSIALVSMLHTYRNLLNLTLLSIAAPPVFAGAMARLEILSAAGDTHRRAIGFRIEKEPLTLADIPAGAEETVAIHAAVQKRGIYRPGRIIVWSRYPLGLFRTWAIIKPDVACVVYPKPVSGPVKFSSGRRDDGNDENPDRPGVDDFAGLKPYQPGDPVNRISWKALSRGRGVFVREFTGTGGMTVMIDHADIAGQDMEWKLSRMCDMVLKAHAVNAEYGLRLPGQAVPPERGDRHKQRCLKALAMFGISE